jgi:hypothetical protein
VIVDESQLDLDHHIALRHGAGSATLTYAQQGSAGNTSSTAFNTMAYDVAPYAVDNTSKSAF